MTDIERCILEIVKCKLEKTKQSPLGKLATAYVKTAIALRNSRLKIGTIPAMMRDGF